MPELPLLQFKGESMRKRLHDEQRGIKLPEIMSDEGRNGFCKWTNRVGYGIVIFYLSVLTIIVGHATIVRIAEWIG